MTVDDWVAEMLGKPFEMGARGPDAFDCYGLVIDAYRRLQGTELIDYTDPPTMGAEIRRVMTNEIEQLWEPDPDGSLLFMRLYGNAHVGYRVSPSSFAHVWEQSGGVRIERNYLWASRIQGTYRYAPR